MKTVAILTAICLIGVIWLLIKGTRDAKEVDDDNAGLTQDEIDAFMARAKDKHLSELIDAWGRKKFGKPEPDMEVTFANGQKQAIDLSENKREFTNRSDFDSVDMEFMNTIH